MTREQAIDEAVRRWHWAWRYQDGNGHQIAPPTGPGEWVATQIHAEFRRIVAEAA